MTGVGLQRLRWLLMVLSVGAAAVSATVVVQDDRNKPIGLAEPARRIVSLAPFITELVYAVGAGDNVVGVSEFSDYPAAARELPRVASAAAVDLERIVALRPELVLAWGSGTSARVVRRLEQLGLNVYVAEPRSPDHIVRNLKALGRLTGNATQARQVAKDFLRQMHEVETNYADREMVSVFYQISERPLMTLNGQHLVSHAIRLCRGVNVFAELKALAPTVTLEEVVRRDADVILINSSLHQVARVKQRWIDMAQLKAAHAGHVYTINADLITRQTPRFVQGVREVCRTLDRARLPILSP